MPLKTVPPKVVQTTIAPMPHVAVIGKLITLIPKQPAVVQKSALNVSIIPTMIL